MRRKYAQQSDCYLRITNQEAREFLDTEFHRYCATSQLERHFMLSSAVLIRH